VFQGLDAVTILVPSYEEGLAFFRDVMGFAVLEDEVLGPSKRWVVVAPQRGSGAWIVLAVPTDERQRSRIGDQLGGRVGYFLRTDDFASDHEALRARGVRFLESPRLESYGRVAVFCDPWGGKWDLLQPADDPGPAGSAGRL
jgi:catechol 2,3-dioxygenase-like lactoylglutathione lyase family enzyme